MAMVEMFQKIGELVDGVTRIGVVSHDRPDGDAIGSSVALGLLLSGRGKEVQVINADAVPDSLAFLPGADRIVSPLEIVSPELLIVVDAAGRDRVSDKVWERFNPGIPVVNIDHHISNTEFGNMNHVDSNSPATGQIIFEIADELGWSLTPEIAENLYAAISTDTGSFRYPNTTAKTYRIAASLIEAGAEVGTLNQRLYESYPQRRVEVLRDLLSGMRIDFDGRCASVSLPRSLTVKLGLGLGDTEGIIDVIRAIDTVVVAVFFEELPDGRIRVSSRSKRESVSVGGICASFGGGGHTLAAGTRMAGPLAAAADRFLSAVEIALDSETK